MFWPRKRTKYPRKQKSLGVSQGFFLRPIGAGEEIRTLDPNLGKVMLYP